MPRMSQKEIALELAAFVDSAQARALSTPREAVRRIAEAVLTACYQDLGKKPRLLDGEDMTALLTHVLPGYVRDRTAKEVPTVVAAWFEHLEATQVVPQAFEVRQALDANEDAFLAAVRAGSEPARVLERETVEHRAEKLGRNDPCFCGSGKKFKKCHGKNG